MLKLMDISGLAFDTSLNIPVVILKEIHGERTLSIRVGMDEAPAIASELDGIKFPRPTTHDLLKNIMELLDVNVREVEIRELKNNKLHALINLNSHGKEMSLDSKISDALALALRVNAPIYVVEEVIQNAAQITLENGPAEISDLENLSLEAFGKYKM
jgi:bifunctional DNase/RNase